MSARLFMPGHYTRAALRGAVRPVSYYYKAKTARLVGDDLLALLAEALDAERHDVARLQEHRVGLMPRPTPGGVPVVMTSPGRSVMYWLTCEMIFAHAEDHGARVAGLHALAVHVEPHVEALRVA